MNKAENLRSKANRALHWAESISDQPTIQSLKKLAANLMQRADSVDQRARQLSVQQQQQQQQQAHRHDEDKE